MPTAIEEKTTMTAAPQSDPEAMSSLIAELNESLAHEYGAVILYRTYASLVQGPWRQELRDFFAGEIPDELGHAQILADKVASLGGVPATEPSPVEVTSDPKQMLRYALADEKATIDRYIRQRRLAGEVGEHGLAVDFDDLIQDESRHRDEIQMILSRWD